MKLDERKAAIAAYKERKAAAGIYAVRCTATGNVWVGQSQSLDSVENRTRFTLRLGTSLHTDLQVAWRDHGAASFTFEVLERLEHEESAYLRSAALEDRLAHWRSALGAKTL